MYDKFNILLSLFSVHFVPETIPHISGFFTFKQSLSGVHSSVTYVTYSTQAYVHTGFIQSKYSENT